MIKKLPKDLPVFLASLVFLAVLAFGASYMYHEFNYRSPKSTFSVDYFVLPLVACFYAVIAYFIGDLAKWLWKKYYKTEYSNTRTFLLIYVLTAILFCVLGLWASIYDMG